MYILLEVSEGSERGRGRAEREREEAAATPHRPTAGSSRFGQKVDEGGGGTDQSCFVLVVGTARQGRVNSFERTGLSAVVRLWAVGMASRCLIPGPG